MLINMKIGIIAVCLFSFCWGIHAAADETNLFHKKLSIRHQAHRAESRHGGRVSYQYSAPDYENAEDVAGNLVIGPTVKEAYVYTVISKKTLKSLKRKNEPLKIGNLEFLGKTRKIVHILEIEGDVKSWFHQNVEIGKISLKKGRAHVENIVLINGSIYAK